MLSTNTISKIIECAQSRGADFSEVFVEESLSSSINLLDKKIDEITSSNSFGIGIRLVHKGQAYYGYSSDPKEENLIKLTKNLGKFSEDANNGLKIFNNQSVEDIHHVVINPENVSKSERVELLRTLDALTRSHGSEINQVKVNIAEKKRTVLIANSEGLWTEDSRLYSRMGLSSVAEINDGPQTASDSPGALGGYEFFQDYDLEKLAESTAKTAIRMASAGYINGGKMPVILGNGFGGVIFHEACGHPLETEAIRKNASPFCNKIGEMVGKPILNAIDDGTIANMWGSCNIDDEGTPTKKTTLIENGILKNYLSDRIGASQVKIPKSGSARRESYKFAPVSRMRNTFITKGSDKIDDMLKSIKFGLYAKKMGGGSVNPGTGEFNFSVQEGFAIRNGKISEPVRGATLIGKGFEILPQISMISDDLELSAGMCGASSGWVPTTVGQPTLKIDSILVGGR
tara:strand:- start:966 stop:2342 length:1377 start_codon:yes stop_codon:yes gene_type:complete